jgi:hypothetical protein
MLSEEDIGPVTPEVAGSSPVAPVQKPCKSTMSVVCLDAGLGSTTQTFSRRDPKAGKPGPEPAISSRSAESRAATRPVVRLQEMAGGHDRRLALLLLRPIQVVPADRLMEELWGETRLGSAPHPPHGTTAARPVQVSLYGSPGLRPRQRPPAQQVCGTSARRGPEARGSQRGDVVRQHARAGQGFGPVACVREGWSAQGRGE